MSRSIVHQIYCFLSWYSFLSRTISFVSWKLEDIAIPIEARSFLPVFGENLNFFLISFILRSQRCRTGGLTMLELKVLMRKSFGDHRLTTHKSGEELYALLLIKMYTSSFTIVFSQWFLRYILLTKPSSPRL